MQILHLVRPRRRAVSPLLATIILMAITTVSAVAVTGFMFGLWGAYTSTAQVSVARASISADLSTTCSVTFVNGGPANTQVTRVDLTYGAAGSGTITASASAGLPRTASAGSSTTWACGGGSVWLSGGGPAAGGLAGGQFSGVAYLSNGGQAFFTGKFS